MQPTSSIKHLAVTFDHLPGLKVFVHRDKPSASESLADKLIDFVRPHPRSALGFATGGSVTDLYTQLCRKGQFLFGGVTTFNLDEYVGLNKGHPQSYLDYMNRLLFNFLEIPPANTHFPDVHHHDLTQAAREYEDKVVAAQIDWQILGIGINGHIGFAEPEANTLVTSLVELHRSTRERAKEAFGGNVDNVPTLALTMGIETVLRAKQLRLLAFGEEKALAIRNAIEINNSHHYPASAIARHNDVEIYLDTGAASLLGIPAIAGFGLVAGHVSNAPLMGMRVMGIR